MTDIGTTLWGWELCLKITLLPSLQPNKVGCRLVLWKMPRGCLCALACLGKNSFLPLLDPLMLCSLILVFVLLKQFGLALSFLYTGGVVLEKTLKSSSDCKKIKWVNPKGNQLWIFIGRIVAKDEAPVLWPSDAESRLIRKDPDAGKDWRQNEKGAEDEMVR